MKQSDVYRDVSYEEKIIDNGSILYTTLDLILLIVRRWTNGL